MEKKQFRWADRGKSFGYAFRGLFRFIQSEHNARLHLAATVAVVIAGCWFRINYLEWLAVITVTGFVWFAEAVNTVLEKLLDWLHPEQHPVVGQLKDLAAGAVLIAALTAAITGGIIFLPRLYEMLTHSAS